MIRQHRSLAPTTANAVEFQRRISALLAPKFGFDADDIAQHETERLLRRIDEIMAAYPVATVYATVRAGHAAQDRVLVRTHPLSIDQPGCDRPRQ